MSDDADYILDIAGLSDAGTNWVPAGSGDGGAANVPADKGDRNWIGVQFECCGVYLRVYRNRSATAYEGSCPRCHRRIRIPIGPGGTTQRIFRAT